MKSNTQNKLVYRLTAIRDRLQKSLTERLGVMPYTTISFFQVVPSGVLPPPTDTLPPTVVLTATPTKTTNTPLSIEVQYNDLSFIDVSTLGNGNVRVTGPNGYSALCTYVSVVPTSNSATNTATYTVAPPSGSWDNADNGTYTVTLQANQVSDTLGNSHPSTVTLGTFQVNIPVPDTSAPTVS